MLMEDNFGMPTDDFSENVENELQMFEYRRNRKKYVSVGDVVLMQCIICVIIIIFLAVLNLLKPDLTNEILRGFKQNLDKPFEYKKEITSIISKLAGIIHA